MKYRPIFIAGCDRSGTTMLGDMLGCSPWAIVTPESQFIHEFVIQMRLTSFAAADNAAAWLEHNSRFLTWNLSQTRSQLADLVELDNPRATVERLLGAYQRQYHPDLNGADVWIDHTPDNFKYHPILKDLFPEARFIHVVRDGRAVSASIKHLNWGPNNAYMASRHWADRLMQALTVEVAESANCLRVHYEQLVSEPDKVLSEICRFIDLPFTADMIDGGGLVLPDFTRRQHRLVGRRPDPEKAQQWKKTTSRTELRDFESYPLSHTLLERMGYEPVFAAPPRLYPWQILGRYLHEYFRYLVNRRSHRRMEQLILRQRRAVHGLADGNGVPDGTDSKKRRNPIWQSSS